MKTAKGHHYWFKLPVGERSVASWSATEGQREAGVSFDVRGEGGGVVAPPSVHESGHVYEFVRDLSALTTATTTMLNSIRQAGSAG